MGLPGHTQAISLGMVFYNDGIWGWSVFCSGYVQQHLCSVRRRPIIVFFLNGRSQFYDWRDLMRHSLRRCVSAAGNWRTADDD